ncbi:hypothetical protein [Phormidesmis sp. 146-33]
MAKPKLKTVKIEVPIEVGDKEAFEAWCTKNQTAMSEEVRRRISRCIREGKKILAEQQRRSLKFRPSANDNFRENSGSR